MTIQQAAQAAAEQAAADKARAEAEAEAEEQRRPAEGVAINMDDFTITYPTLSQARLAAAELLDDDHGVAYIINLGDHFVVTTDRGAAANHLRSGAAISAMYRDDVKAAS